MSLRIASLNSGSNGNCYYIGNEEDAILVDAGLSCRETEKRMRRLGLPVESVRAIFVSHEHDDHIRGIPILARKYQLPVYITGGTLQNWGFALDTHLVRSFSAYMPVAIGALSITAFPKFHDAADPHSFIVTQGPTVIGVFTDIGAPCEHLIRHFRKCHAVFLESNYDEAMLSNGSYPWHLKRRISGGQGHLSNRQALELFLAHRPPFMTHVLLSHLSHNNNDPELALALFHGRVEGVRVVVASRYEETALYTIQGKEGDVMDEWVEVVRAAIAAGEDAAHEGGPGGHGRGEHGSGGDGRGSGTVQAFGGEGRGSGTVQGFGGEGQQGPGLTGNSVQARKALLRAAKKKAEDPRQMRLF